MRLLLDSKGILRGSALTNELPRDYCIVEGKATILQVQRLLAYQLKEQLGKRKRRDDNEEEEEGE